MKILFAASEAVPFCKTGGLADVAGSLPQALAAAGNEVEVILPMYQRVSDNWKDKMTFICNIEVPLGWRRVYCGLFRLDKDGVIWYFVDNEYYFKRDSLYGHYDDGERYGFFSRAVISLLPALQFMPEIIHCNDWQTALVPIYLKDECVRWSEIRGIKTVFTVHNIEYQGRYGKETLEDLFGLAPGWFADGTIAMDGDVNLLKGALMTCDAITAVSPTYAQELRYAYFAHGMESVIRLNGGKVYGVLNGIDMDYYNPATDKRLVANYGLNYVPEAPESEESESKDAKNTKDSKDAKASKDTKKKAVKKAAPPADPMDTVLPGKAENKANLQKEMGLAAAPDVPVIGIVSRLVSHKGLDLICKVFDQIMGLNCQFVILGSGDWNYEQFFEAKIGQYRGRMALYRGYNEALAMKIYSGADLLLMPSKSEPCGLAQMIAMRYGTVPIVRETGGLKDTVHAYEAWCGAGNGFTFADYNSNDMLYVIRQAVDLYYNNAPAFRKLQLAGMSEDFSWPRRAEEYNKIYQKIRS